MKTSVRRKVEAIFAKHGVRVPRVAKSTPPHAVNIPVRHGSGVPGGPVRVIHRDSDHAKKLSHGHRRSAV